MKTRTGLFTAVLIAGWMSTAALAGGLGKVTVSGNFDRAGEVDFATSDPDRRDYHRITIGYGSPDGGVAVRHLSFTLGLSAGTQTAAARVGEAMAVGDFNGDGFDDLAVGAPGYDRNSGIVIVFYGSEAGLTLTDAQVWSQDSPGIEGRSDRNDLFGSALAAGNLDRPGDRFADDLVIGVPGEDNNAGAVNVIRGRRDVGLVSSGDRIYTQNSYGIPGDKEAGDQFGTAVAMGAFYGGHCRGSGPEPHVWVVPSVGNYNCGIVVGIPGEDIRRNSIRDCGAVLVIVQA